MFLNRYLSAELPKEQQPNLNNGDQIDEANQVLLRLNSAVLYIDKEINDRFKILFNQLLTMGFKPRIINNCFRLHRFLSLQEAVELMLQVRGKYIHKFIEKENYSNGLEVSHISQSQTKICDLCEEPIENHLAFRDVTALDQVQSSNNLVLQRIASKFLLESKKTKEGQIEINVPSPINLPNLPSLINENISPPHIELKVLKSIHMKTCEICLDDFDYSNIEEKFKLECTHPYCETCLMYHLETEITNGRVKKIVCPYKNCSFEFIEKHIEVLLSDKDKIQLFTKYLKFKKTQELESDPNIIFCPQPDCEGFIKLDNQENLPSMMPMLTMCQFNHEICTRCGQLWHSDKKCETLLDDEIEKLVLAHKMKMKRCPGCSNWTEKNEGCNHMTCVFCLFQWCWLCNQRYTPSHYNKPGSKCQGKQFPNAGQFDWEDYDPQAYEYAKLHKDDPILPEDLIVYVVNQPANVVIHQPRPEIERIPMSGWEYIKSLSIGMYMRDISENSSIFVSLLIDCIMFFFFALCNFVGNSFVLVYLWKNEKYIYGNRVFRRSGCSKLMYYITMFMLWSMFLINTLGSIIASFFINISISIVLHTRNFFISDEN